MSMTLGKGGNPAQQTNMKQRERLEKPNQQECTDDTGGGMRKGKGPTFLNGDRLRRRLHAVTIRSATSGEAARRRCRRDGCGERAPGQGQVARSGSDGREQGRRTAGRGGSGHGGDLHRRGAVANGTMRGGGARARREQRRWRTGDRNEDGKGQGEQPRFCGAFLWELRSSGCWFLFALTCHFNSPFAQLNFTNKIFL